MMRLVRFEEPLLQFGTSQHVDIRFGLMNYCPLDFDKGETPKKIRVGIVGSATSVEGLRDWLEKCQQEIPAKQSRQPNLFPKFPGFNADCAFHAQLITDSSLQRDMSSSQMRAIANAAVLDERKIEGTRALVELGAITVRQEAS